MAIGTGDAIEKFGTQLPVTGAGISISSGAMSTQANATAWTNTDDATDADVLMEATFAAAPNASGTVVVYARKLNVRDPNDNNIPTLNNQSIYIGTLFLDSANVAQVTTTRVQLPNGKANQEYEFYFKNSGGQNISSMQAWITPIAVGPSA